MITASSHLNPFIQLAIDRYPLIVAPDTTILAAIDAMAAIGTSCILVVGQDERYNAANSLPVGILTEGDLVRVVAQVAHVDRWQIQAVMSHPVITISAEASNDLATVMTLFQSHNVQHLPVIDKDNCTIGVLEKRLLTEILAQQFLQQTGDNGSVSEQAISKDISPIQIDDSDRSIFDNLDRYQDPENSSDIWDIDRTLLQSISEVEISTRKHVEAELVATEAKFRQLVEGVNDVIWEVDRDGRYTYLSPQFQTLFGWDPREWIGRLFLETIYSDDLSFVIDDYRKDPQSHERLSSPEFRHCHQDGSYRWVRISATPIIQNGEIVGKRGILTDITDRKQVEIALQESQHFIEKIADASPNILYIYDWTEGCNVYINRGIATVLHYDPTEIQSMGANLFQTLIHPDDLQQVSTHHARIATARDGEIFEFEYRMKRADGNWCWLLSRDAIFSRDLQGNVRQTIGTAQDITEQRAMLDERQEYEQRLEYSNAELLRATRLKDEFLANMSHELRTPLNAILGLSEGLLDELLGSLTDRQKKAISTIERSGEHLLSLINDILDVSKIEAGKLELSITSTSIVNLCNSSLTFVKEQANKKQIQITANFALDLENINVDERRMRQVLINLLNNAVKFTPAGGKVTLETQLEAVKLDPSDKHLHSGELDFDNWLILAVRDTGIGIAAENLAKLFQPFVQIDGSLNRQYEGTGLGLTLVKQIVELHGGGVTLTSELGRGSCFRLRLPYRISVAERPLSTPSPDPQPSSIDLDLPATAQIQPPLILLAEDNQSNIYSFSNYLKAYNYRPIVAQNGREAIDLAQTHIPDLILMDIQMPGIDGLEAIQIIRRNPQLQSIPIIALTALAMAEDRDKCLAAGANEYLTKPVKMKQLIATIQQLLQPR